MKKTMAEETNGRNKPAHEELLEALRVIRAECEWHEHCYDCPLRASSLTCGWDCSVKKNAPFDWNVKSVDDSDWLAFYA